MEKSAEIKALLQNVVEELQYAEKYCKSYMLKAQRVGLQGEKRRLRYESVKYHNLINYLECDYYDLYGSDLEVQYMERHIPTVKGVKDFFEKVLEYFEKRYDRLHKIANDLVVANGRNYASCLYAHCDCLIEYIKEYRRVLVEGEMSGWTDAYIQRLMLHETTWHNVHDHYEDKEKSVGYDF